MGLIALVIFTTLSGTSLLDWIIESRVFAMLIVFELVIVAIMVFVAVKLFRFQFLTSYIFFVDYSIILK